MKIATATEASYPDLWNEEYFGSPLRVRVNLHGGPSPKYWVFLTQHPRTGLSRWTTRPERDAMRQVREMGAYVGVHTP